jgi:hypothetical protein
VTFTSLEVQRMAALRSEDVVIVKSPTRNPMGFGLAPPRPSSSLGGGGAGYVGGGGFGGFGGVGGFGGGGGLRTSHGFDVGGNVAYGSEPAGGIGGGGGISGGGGGRMFGGGGGSSFSVSPKEVSPRKTPFEEPPMVIDTTALPSAENAYMDYTKHVNAGLAGEAWRLQTRHRDRNKRVNGDSEALEGGGSQNVAHAYVLDGNKGGKTNTTGTITPDVTL